MTQMLTVPDIILMGDSTRYVFLRWLLGYDFPEEVKDVPAYVFHGMENKIETRQDIWLFHTRRMLLSTALLVAPPDGWDFVADAMRQAAEHPPLCVFCSGFPFLRDEEVLKASMKIRQTFPFAPALVALMDLRRRVSPTDLTKSGEDVAGAIKHIAGQGLPCLTLQGEPDVWRALNWREPLSLSWSRRLQAVVESMRYSCNPETIGIYYEEALQQFKDEENGVLGTRIFLEIFSACAKGPSKRGPLEICFQELNRRFFPKSRAGGLYPVAQVYLDLLEDAGVIPYGDDGGGPLWNVAYDRDEFLKEIQKSLRLFMEARFGTISPNPARRPKADAPSADWENRFRKEADNFVQKEIPAMLEARLRERIKMLEGVLA